MRNLPPLLLALLLHGSAVAVAVASASASARRSSSSYYEDSSRRYVTFGKWTVPESDNRRRTRSAANGGDKSQSTSSSSTLLMAFGGPDVANGDASRRTSSRDPVAFCSSVSDTAVDDDTANINSSWSSHSQQSNAKQGRGARLLARVGTQSRLRKLRRPTPTTCPRIPDGDSNDTTRNDSAATSTSTSTVEAQDESSMRQALVQPLIPKSVWDQLHGDEFQRFPDLLDGLSETGEMLARQDFSNIWIDWKIHSSGGVSLEDGDVLVWTGKSLKEGYGSAVPWIKTRSIIPLAADEMVELLMDSSRVTTYNPWSLGRQDCWVAAADNNPAADPIHPLRQTKIVKNRVQPPMGAKPAVSVTMLHARPVNDDGTWLVISRATGGNLYPELDQDAVGRSDILLGVNLIQPVDDDSCMLTAVTHAYSAIMPAMLAERLGVKGAIKFISDIRALRVPAS
jgi:hypothetical protein